MTEHDLPRWHGRVAARCRRIAGKAVRFEAGSPDANRHAERLLEAGAELLVVERLMGMDALEVRTVTADRLGRLLAEVEPDAVWRRLGLKPLLEVAR